MYRPTVRYDERFREYVEALFESTRLDRNQIMRLALFLLGHTKEGREALTFFSSSPLPEPLWEQNNHVLWYGAECHFTFSAGETLTPEGGTSNEYNHKESLPGPQRQTPRRDHREIHPKTENKKGGIVVNVGSGTTIFYT